MYDWLGQCQEEGQERDRGVWGYLMGVLWGMLTLLPIPSSRCCCCCWLWSRLMRNLKKKKLSI